MKARAVHWKLLRNLHRWNSKAGVLPQKLGFNKVFCVGWLKTGTSSFAYAMRSLGFIHQSYSSLYRDLFLEDRLDILLDLARAYDSFDDLPWNRVEFIPLLDKHFPHSKFVLLERDTGSWLESAKKMTERHGRTFEDKGGRVRYFEERNAYIREYFSARPDDLLVLNLFAGEGYEKLCPFLNLGVIDAPFPHVNRAPH